MRTEEHNGTSAAGGKEPKESDGNGMPAAAWNGTALTDPEKSAASLTDLMHAGMGIPSPFMKEIYLLRQAIVGTRYQGGSDTLVADLQPGSRISFVAEPDNRYDKNAVMALDSKGRKIGYIPRHENGIIGALLKAGKSIYGIMPDEQPDGGMAAPGTENTPFAIWVDLYMREFLLPDDLSRVPRQGYRGSYAVADFIPWADGEERISSIFAIKVINGEERDMFCRNIGREDPESFREAIQAFHEFVGYLPIVSHDIMEDILPQLEEAYGVQLGLPFSNHVIDTLQMAANHLPYVCDATLDGLAEALGIEVHCDTREEERCRIIWKLYCRMERSELGRQEHHPTDSNKRTADAAHTAPLSDDRAIQPEACRLDESIEAYPLSSMTRQTLRANGIITLRELSRYTEDEINYMDYADDDCFRELMAALEREGVHPRPEDQEDFLYGYPDSMKVTAKEKDRFWEVKLLFEGIIVWYQWLKPVRDLYLPVWCAGDLAKPLHEKIEVLDWIGGQLDELRSFGEDLADTMNHDVRFAVGGSGERGDARSIMNAVEKLMGIYKRALLWRQSFSQIDTQDDYRNLMEVFFSLSSNAVFQVFDELYKKSIRGMNQIRDCLDGRITEKRLELDLKVDFEIDEEGFEEILHDLAEA